MLGDDTEIPQCRIGGSATFAYYGERQWSKFTIFDDNLMRNIIAVRDKIEKYLIELINYSSGITTNKRLR